MSNYYLDGIVSALGTKQVTSKKNGKQYTVHSVEVNGTWVEVGFKQPYRVGDQVVADVEFAYKRYQITENPANPLLPAMPVGSAAGSPPPAASPGPSVGSAPSSSQASSSFPIPMSDGRQTSIIRQNALTNAVVAANAVFLAGDRKVTLEEHAAAIISLAYKFAGFSSGNLDADVVAKATE